MSLQDLVIQSQLVPPSPRRGLRVRPRLASRLGAVYEYPLTILQAGTGHSKTTTLAAFARAADDAFWYTITESERDPLLFLAHLFSAFNQRGRGLGAAAFDALAERSAGGSPGAVSPAALTPLLNALTAGLRQPAVLVLDDYHLVADVAEIAALVERLVDYLPPNLHVVLSTRQMPKFSALTRWRAKNMVFLLQRADLAFTPDEIASLFREEFGLPITDAQIEAIAQETEGWAIALQMIWQHLQTSATATLGGGPDPAQRMVYRLDDVLSRLPETLEGLFDYLAEEVLNRQPEAVRRFLLTTSVLRVLTGPACDAVAGDIPGEPGQQSGSAEMLSRLHDQGLFLSSIDNHAYRYQHLFRDFLRVQLKRRGGDLSDLHCRAAGYFERAGQPEETIYHLLEAEDFSNAAARIAEIGGQLVSQGRLESLIGWVERIPEGVAAEHPALRLLLGDAHRLRSRFDEALEHYAAAGRLFAQRGSSRGQSRALRGQAQVYLDTIRPVKADSLLQDALRLLDPNVHRLEVAELLEQLAENRLNIGHPEEAESYHREASALRAADGETGETAAPSIFLEGRAMLRTGRLAEAVTLLESRAAQERLGAAFEGGAPERPQRFHREIPTLLSLIHSLLGNADQAEAFAREGIATGKRLESAFVEAVGYMRLGHALIMKGLRPWHGARRAEAISAYERAVELVRPFRVTRVIVEPLWGLCRAYGLEGSLTQAEIYASQALEIAEQAGDGWIANLVRVSMGSSLVMQGHDGQAWLDQAREGFRAVGDPHAECAALLWLAQNHHRQNRRDAAREALAESLRLAEGHGYDHLFTRVTHLGLVEAQAALPLLLDMRESGLFAHSQSYLDHLLANFGAEPGDARAGGLAGHPGCSLSVRALGPFAAWRGREPIRPQDWQRDKARQLFLLLLTEKLAPGGGRWMTREQIADRLWPHLDAEAAVRDFKAALNALNRALEPDRAPGAQPFFLQRRDGLYGLNPLAKIHTDVDDFLYLAQSDDPAEMRAGLALYEQDYLADVILEDWAEPPREQLRLAYLIAAVRLAEMLFGRQQHEDALAACHLAITRDRAWEPAYRLMMQIHAAQGNRPQVRAVYNRLTAALDDELGVQPSEETEELVERLLG